MNGVEIIYAERRRQIEKEGWTPEHDAQHDQGELADAGGCYALADYHRRQVEFDVSSIDRSPPTEWPFESKWWKTVPDDRIRELAKAGGFIAAEIDRLIREKTGEDPVYLPAGPETLGEMEVWCNDMLRKIADARAGKCVSLGDILRSG